MSPLTYTCIVVRKTTGLFLAFLIISQSFMSLGLYTYYNLNKKAITEKLCINKNKPSMHCNGHCFLSKQLKEVEQKERQQSQSIKDKEEQVISIHELNSLSYLPHFIETGHYPTEVTGYLFSGHRKILLPPKIAA